MQIILSLLFLLHICLAYAHPTKNNIIQSPPTIITTEHLELRSIMSYKDTELDTLALQLFTACPNSVRKTLFCGKEPGPWSTAKARQKITFWRTGIDKQQAGKNTLTLWKYFIFLKGTQTLIGSVSFHTMQDDGCWKTGYWLNPDHQGKGYMTEAAKTLIAFYFTLTNAPRLYACVPNINGKIHEKSAQVCKRLGFVEEKTNTPRPLGCPCAHKFVLSSQQF